MSRCRFGYFLAFFAVAVCVVSPGVERSALARTVEDLPPIGEMDVPRYGETVRGTVSVSGWALDYEEAAVTVRVYVDGDPVGQADYPVGVRPDIQEFFPYVPHSAQTAFRFSLDTTVFADGDHVIEVTAADSTSVPHTIGQATVNFDNSSPPVARPWPDSSGGLQVFAGQLSASMSNAQFQFAATHYAGCEQMTRSDAELLRIHNPDFLMMNANDQFLARTQVLRIPQGVAQAPFAIDDIGPFEKPLAGPDVVDVVPVPLIDLHFAFGRCRKAVDEILDELQVVPGEQYLQCVSGRYDGPPRALRVLADGGHKAFESALVGEITGDAGYVFRGLRVQIRIVCKPLELIDKFLRVIHIQWIVRAEQIRLDFTRIHQRRQAQRGIFKHFCREFRTVVEDLMPPGCRDMAVGDNLLRFGVRLAPMPHDAGSVLETPGQVLFVVGNQRAIEKIVADEMKLVRGVFLSQFVESVQRFVDVVLRGERSRVTQPDRPLALRQRRTPGAFGNHRRQHEEFVVAGHFKFLQQKRLGLRRLAEEAFVVPVEFGQLAAIEMRRIADVGPGFAFGCNGRLDQGASHGVGLRIRPDKNQVGSSMAVNQGDKVGGHLGTELRCPSKRRHRLVPFFFLKRRVPGVDEFDIATVKQTLNDSIALRRCFSKDGDVVPLISGQHLGERGKPDGRAADPIEIYVAVEQQANPFHGGLLSFGGPQEPLSRIGVGFARRKFQKVVSITR